MEAGAGRGEPLPMPSHSGRKEWRAVTENSIRASPVSEEIDLSKLTQSSDERTIYEVQQGSGPLDVDFCSITIDNVPNGDPLQQRLHDISTQREELQQMEIDLRAEFIARSEIMEMRKSFDAQLKEHANNAAKLKEQLQERERCLHELEMKMEEKERELRAIKIDNEAVWAKEDRLREQNKELATFRRERDNSDAERAQHLSQIHELKEHIQEKERQSQEMEEQHRAAQEAILYKDEQLREAQAWVARAQEMDALQSTANHSLQAELRERTDQFNQLWIGCQRQLAEMERHHLHTIQQLQLELAETRDRNGNFSENGRISRANTKDTTAYQNKGNQFDANEANGLNGNLGILTNGDIENGSHFVQASVASTHVEHAPGLPVVPPSLMSVSAFLPPGQAALHPFVMHQHNVAPSMPSANSHITQPHVGQFQPISAVPSHQHWQHQQVITETPQMTIQNQYHVSQTEHGHLRPEMHFDCDPSLERNLISSDYLEAHCNPDQKSGPTVIISSEEEQIQKLALNRSMASQQADHNIEGASQFPDQLELSENTCQNEHKDVSEGMVQPQTADGSRGLDSTNSVSVPQGRDRDKKIVGGANQSNAQQSLSGSLEKLSMLTVSDAPNQTKNPRDNIPEIPPSSVTSGIMGPAKVLESQLLDERSLLSCLVRAIPVGGSGRIRISTTLLTRLSKMLAPLQWDDYKQRHGRLEDFVACHPQLFVIEGDFIHLREGAHAIISATTAAAKVAAAAAASPGGSGLLPTVALTPVAQIRRPKRNSSFDPNPQNPNLMGNTENTMFTNRAIVQGKPLQLMVKQNQSLNGHSSIKILSKPRDLQGQNGALAEMRSSSSSLNATVGSGARPDKGGSNTFQSNGSNSGANGMNLGTKQQGRVPAASLNAKR
ncbi:uncharacterized protein LOC18435425 isoform X1 [Amborella trichopoda]|nr:uncharacterized protein LOC18435425 isoform X1 [Amborella trichopoda]|eukprot:XP_006845533.2 uncharacterized protein LOC18435425 isoform X1 [Amborella trichopoda]